MAPREAYYHYYEHSPDANHRHQAQKPQLGSSVMYGGKLLQNHDYDLNLVNAPFGTVDHSFGMAFGSSPPPPRAIPMGAPHPNE